MKYKYPLTLLSVVIATSAQSASFMYKGEVVTSSTAVETTDCGTYKVDLRHEQFPLKYEDYIPSEFLIKGFDGSPTTIAKQVVIQPAGVVVPPPNNLVELKPLYKDDKTYLPSSVACKGSQLIISYWSGGNCSECEAFIAFEYSDAQLSNPKKVTYRDFAAISK